MNQGRFTYYLILRLMGSAKHLNCTYDYIHYLCMYMVYMHIYIRMYVYIWSILQSNYVCTLQSEVVSIITQIYVYTIYLYAIVISACLSSWH